MRWQWRKDKPNKWQLSLQTLIVLLLPVVLVGSSISLLLTRQWLELEYSRETFPPDLLGWEQQERSQLAAATLDWILKGSELELVSLKDGDRGLVYNKREVEHLIDVKRVVDGFRGVYQLSVVVMAGLLIWLAHNRDFKKKLIQVLAMGGIVTLTLMTILTMMVTLAWDKFFANFHQLFFKPGTWLFYSDDNLIRLFPERFFVDSAVAAVAISAVVGALLALIPNVGLKKKKRWLRFLKK